MKRIIILILTILALFSWAAWYLGTHDEDLKVFSINTKLGPAKFNIDLAKNPNTREQGLMYRREMPEDHGMLFVFDNLSRQIFWMKNTFIYLDLIFFDDDFKIIGLIENAQPQSLKALDIGLASRYVLEINAGLVKKYAIAIGNSAKLEVSP